MSDHLPESFSLASILAEKACTTRKDSDSEWSAKDNPETNPITTKPETASHVTELFSWVPLPYCSPPRCPFPIKSLALSAHVSIQTIHFWVLDTSPVSGPGRCPPSCNTAMNIGMHISFLHTDFIFSRYIPRSEIAVLHGSSFLIFWGIAILFFHNTVPIYIPTVY